MAKRKPRTFRPDAQYTDYEGLRQYYYKLDVAFKVFDEFAEKYRCGVHAGMGKWISVGLYKEKWLKRWRLDMTLNSFFFDNEKEFYALEEVKYVHRPILLSDFIDKRSQIDTLAEYSPTEVRDYARIKKDIEAALENAFDRGNIWKF